MHRNAIDCEVLTGTERNKRILIPRINLTYSGIFIFSSLSWSVIGHFPPCYDVFQAAYTNCRKTVEMKMHQISCLFAKNVMISNKIVYKPRWEGISFLSRALVHLGYALVNYLSSRQE
jgi:hypothetical protein